MLLVSIDVKSEEDQKSKIMEEITNKTIDACSNASLVSNDVKTEVNKESDITKKITEETAGVGSDVRLASNEIKTKTDQESEITRGITKETKHACSNERLASNAIKTEAEQESEITREITEETKDAGSNVRLASNDVKTEVDQESEITREITEETKDDGSNVRLASNNVKTEVEQESEITRETIGENKDDGSNVRLASNDVQTGVDQDSEITEEIRMETTNACINLRMTSNNNNTEADKESIITEEITEMSIDACSNEKLVSNVVKTEVDQKSKITEEITESAIEANFNRQRSYLEKHIDVSDLIAYYESFTQEERRKLHEENGVNHEAAARSAFRIIEERTQSDKYTLLLFALDDAGYPKLVDLLKGKLVPGNTLNRQRINAATRHIYERLTPSNVLHYLVSWGVITFGESEQIAKRERTESRHHAALDLLFILPNRSKDWYTLFLQALLYGDEHTQLAELIDQRKTEQIKAQRLAGMKTHICDSNTSLQIPVHEAVTRSYESLPSSDVSRALSVSKQLGNVNEISSQLGDLQSVPETSFPQASALTGKKQISKRRHDISQISVIRHNLNIRLMQDKETCHTGGISVTSRGVLLMSDWNNKSVKAFSQDNKLLSSLTFSVETVDISVINDQTAAVSTINNKLHILNISDPANISIDRSVSLGYLVAGMTHYRGNLIVTSWTEPKCLKMIDLNGQEKWSVSVDHKGQQLFDKPYSVTISTSNDTPTVIVSDWSKERLTLIDPNDGHLIKTIDVTGKYPHGLTSDNDGNVYAGYMRRQEICVFSPDFEKSRILLSSSDRRGNPTNIVYCSNSDVLYISYKENDIVDCFQLA